jgi:cytochrome c biogenesis protein CcmG/thiol:disulfide interchange protein DsbE
VSEGTRFRAGRTEVVTTVVVVLLVVLGVVALWPRSASPEPAASAPAAGDLTAVRAAASLLPCPAPTGATPAGPLAGVSVPCLGQEGVTDVGAAVAGRTVLVNVWASWCVPCHDEAPLLMKLADDKRIRIIGINYKDQPENARRFIGRYGNPFAAVGADVNGRASIDWGVYGVPETFVIDRDGRIAYKLVGPISAENLDAVLKPQLEKALAAP